MNNKIIEIVIFVVGVASISILVLLIYESWKHKSYVNRIKNLRIKERIKGLSIINRIEYHIANNAKFEIKGFRISPYIFVFLSFVFSVIMFFISKKVLNIISASLIISIWCFILPFQILKLLDKRRKDLILKNFPTYLASLKNYTKTENNIVVALKKAKPNSEIEQYINNFNNQVENGVKIYDAFEELKNNISIEKISELITLLEYCYINGGDFNDLIDRYSKILTRINVHKEEEQEKTLGTKMVLVVLIIINIYMLFGFIYANPMYRQIMIETFIGRLIVDINIISYLFIFILFQKMDEMGEK